MVKYCCRIDTTIITQENKDMSEQKVSKDKRYEDRHKEERKAKCMIWGTSVERPLGEEINEFLKLTGFTKVELIKAGYQTLVEKSSKNK